MSNSFGSFTGQIIAAIIGGIFLVIATCVGVIVFSFLLGGDGQDAIPAPVPQVSNSNISSSSNSQSNTIVEQPISPTSTPVPTPTETVFSPNVSAGEPITYDGFELLIGKKIKISQRFGKGPFISIEEGYLKNLTNDQKIVRWTLYAFRLKDDLGNEYPHFAISQEALREAKQTLIDPNESARLYSNDGHPGQWSDESIYYTVFGGTIHSEASQLILEIDGLGSFPSLKIHFDL